MPNDDLPLHRPQKFEPTVFLAGRTLAWGIFEDRFGRLRRRFTVEMNGRWQDGVFLLDEKFAYDTGDTEHRTWRIVQGEGAGFSATCDDCIGEAEGSCDTNSIRMRYKFRLKLTDRSLVVDFDDCIYRMSDGIAVNRARMSKWGIRLGELSLFFSKDEWSSLPRIAA